MIEEETDEQQIRDAEADYKAGRFARVRALVKEGKTVLIYLIQEEVRGIDRRIVFEEGEGILYFKHLNSSLNLYLEEGTFALIQHNLEGVISERDMRLLLDMVKVVKTYGFRERET